MTLTGAVATGAFWAERLYHNAWLRDPKILFTLATWVLYAAALLLRRLRRWQGRQTALASLAGLRRRSCSPWWRSTSSSRTSTASSEPGAAMSDGRQARAAAAPRWARTSAARRSSCASGCRAAEEEAEKALVHLLARPGWPRRSCSRPATAPSSTSSRATRTAPTAPPWSMIFLPRAPELERPGRLYVKRNGEAARHLLAVASGLESMVLGEPEILGQVKRRRRSAEAWSRGTGAQRLLRSATSAGERARQETAITRRRGIARLRDRRAGAADLQRARGVPVLLIGAGEIARSVGPAAGRARRARAAGGQPQRGAGAPVQGGVAARPSSSPSTERLDALRTADW